MTWRQWIILLLYAAVSFGGSFSDLTCKTGGDSGGVIIHNNDNNK